MINKEERKKHIEFSKEILKQLQERTGLKLRRRVLKMVGNNPFIEMRVNDWENDEINNELLKIICITLNHTPLNWDCIKYGNISNKGITLHLREWERVLNAIGKPQSNEKEGSLE